MLLTLAGNAEQSVSAGASEVVQFLTVIFLFLFVLAITLFTTRWIANYQKGKSFGANIEVLETCRVTTNKYIQIVRLGGKYLAIGIGKDEITFLCELEEADIHLPEAVIEPAMNFGSILEKLKNNMK